MPASTTQTADRLLALLPAIYSEDPLLGRYLWPFQQMLTGLEQAIDDIATLFDPSTAPEEFLPWLSSWMALTLRADLDVAQRREFLARVVSLYRWRGTKQNLLTLLEIFTDGGQPTIVEVAAPLQIGITATVGVDTFIDGGPAHYFKATVKLVDPDNEQAANQPVSERLERQLRRAAIARAVIELEKPAHTYYDLQIIAADQMQIEDASTIGVDTVIGTYPDE